MPGPPFTARVELVEALEGLLPPLALQAVVADPWAVPVPAPVPLAAPTSLWAPDRRMTSLVLLLALGPVLLLVPPAPAAAVAAAAVVAGHPWMTTALRVATGRLVTTASPVRLLPMLAPSSARRLLCRPAARAPRPHLVALVVTPAMSPETPLLPRSRRATPMRVLLPPGGTRGVPGTKTKIRTEHPMILARALADVT